MLYCVCRARNAHRHGTYNHKGCIVFQPKKMTFAFCWQLEHVVAVFSVYIEIEASSMYIWSSKVECVNSLCE